ncbi:hypothetical protein Bcen2424_5756 [Burkholderia cenocepacia HI2424]|nr:hypothetical protein Bcen2424_5756 [Burkholderia cenocepacia HI2424]
MFGAGLAMSPQAARRKDRCSGEIAPYEPRSVGGRMYERNWPPSVAVLQPRTCVGVAAERDSADSSARVASLHRCGKVMHAPFVFTNDAAK